MCDSGHKKRKSECHGNTCHGEQHDQCNHKLSLFSYYRSSAAWRVRIALHHKNLPFEYKAVNILKNEHTQSEYTKLNPTKTVPTLLDGDKAIGQSLAIIEYLDQVFPNQPLVPQDPYTGAKARELALLVACDIHPIQNLRVLNYVESKTNAEEKANWAKYWIENGLKAMEEEVGSTMGKYCVGDDVSIADVCLVPQLYNARRWNCDLSQFPRLVAIETELSKLKAFQLSHASNQPDTPPS